MPDFSSKRCFIAFPLDQAAREDVCEAVEGVQIEGLRLTAPQNLHVTLKFLGDVDDPDLPSVIAVLESVARAAQAFDLEIQGVDYLPDAHRPRVLAATMSAPEPVLSLFERIESALMPLGFPREGRRYNPHITLGRLHRPPRPLPAPDTFRLLPTTLPVQEFVLFQSTLGGANPVYAPLAHFRLGPD